MVTHRGEVQNIYVLELFKGFVLETVSQSKNGQEEALFELQIKANFDFFGGKTASISHGQLSP